MQRTLLQNEVCTSGQERDILVESSGVSVLVDSKTALYLRGTTLNYSDRMVAGGSSLRTQTLRQVVVVAKVSTSELSR